MNFDRSADIAVPGPGEPTLESLRTPLRRLIIATRLPFLTITVVGCLLGLAVAQQQGAALSPLLATITVLLAVLAHAAVNVLNDWADHLNGTDAANTERIFPFTGGSRFIQNGVMSAAAVRRYALALFAFTIGGGLALASVVGAELLWFGVAGLALGWAYSAPPLALNSRGLGEFCVAACFLMLVPGSDFVQRGAHDLTPWLAGIPFALMTTNILYINQFPDRTADIAAGKLHWVARLDRRTATLGYALMLALAASSLLASIVVGALPLWSALGFIGFAPAIPAARSLIVSGGAVVGLAPAIKQTILAAHLVALLTALGLLLA